jgi:hypothetical protein
MDERAAALLGALRPANHANWSQADIDAQQSGSAARIILSGGTDSAEMALFSTDELPSSGNLDDGAVERLERQGLAIRFETDADGSYLMHLYVDEPVPDGVIKYSVPALKRSAILRTGGGIAFGGLESMCSDFQENESIRSDAKIPAGEYEVEIDFVAYPDEMVRVAIHKQAWASQSPWLRATPAAIGAAVLLAIGSLIVHAWWLAGALFAMAAVFGGKLLFGNAIRQKAVQRANEAALNFPTIVAEVRRKPR